MQTQRKSYGGPDYFRLAAAFLVIAIHTSPLASVNGGADFFLTRVLARTAVPFFFMVTGHFVLSGLFSQDSEERLRCTRRAGKYLLRLCILYLASVALYLPLGIYAGHYRELSVSGALRMLLFDGTFYHLWYFPACILGVLLLLALSRFLQLKAVCAVSVLLYLFGLFGDSYYGLTEKIPVLKTVYEAMFRLFSYTRNGLFLAPVFLTLGILAGASAEAAPAKKRANSAPVTADLAGASAEVAPEKNRSNFAPVTAEFPVKGQKLRLPRRVLFLALSFCAMTAEAFLLRHFDLQRHDSMYLFLIPVSYFLYCCLLSVPAAPRKLFRTASTWIYVLHPAFIVVVRGAAKVLRLTGLLIDNSLIHYLAVSCLSAAAGLFLSYAAAFLRRKKAQSGRPESAGAYGGRLAAGSSSEEDTEPADGLFPDESIRKPTDGLFPDENACISVNGLSPEERTRKSVDDLFPEGSACKSADGISCENRLDVPSGNRFSEKHDKSVTFLPGTERAWIELNLNALEHNVRFLQSCLPADCRLMPAVKADAYGHGAEIIAGELNRLGVCDFCVACVSEGIALREAGIRGQILILGYTHPSQFPLLCRYRLTQTVIDFPYAEQMQYFGQKLHVHIAVDTGMHRLGIPCGKPEEILFVYRMKNLFVDGIFTHLSSCDSSDAPCKAFTENQINAFYQVVDRLKEAGCDCRGLHLLSSYGIANYPDAAEDYVRPGIALYGTLSSPGDPFADFLRPVLSLKARVASVRTLRPGESAGYGMAFTAQRPTRIAVLSIGYADGLPRELSSGAGSVLLNGRRAPVIGRICMDQTLVDVSEIPDVFQNDTAVLIGSLGEEQITAAQMADQCSTIANELLSRLGVRLPRIEFVDD
ncbi:MAG: serine racemase VanT catalytic subunit [bacterium]|nr:serine racemase VanT catalytic subunit [bacterium]